MVEYDFENTGLVGIASSLYDDLESVRYKATLQTAEAYQERHIPLVIVDASPLPEVTDALQERGAVVLKAPRPGRATQYIDGTKFAIQNGAARVVCHEPEKIGMVTFAEPIIEALKTNDAVVIGRTEGAIGSLPSTMAKTEQLAGWLMQKFLDFPADALSGGRAYTERGAQYLLNYDVEEDGNNNWLFLHLPILAAREAGLPIGGIQVDLIYPPAMRTEEEANPAFEAKRFQQFFMQMEPLLKLAGYQSTSL